MERASNTDSFTAMVDELNSKFLQLWDHTSESIPEFPHRFSSRQQLENERKVESGLREMPSSLSVYEGLEQGHRTKVRLRAMKALRFLPFASQDILKDRLFEASEAATGSFIREARLFDVSITEDEILQALRNFWVFNSIQTIFGLRASLTPSSLAYSLLYPYTDNGLDAQRGFGRQKAQLLEWLDRWLEGIEIPPANSLVAKIARLLRMIENEFPRSRFPDLHGSLRAIHHAQEKSLVLHGATPGRNEVSLTAITFEKGGTSVLVDGYLASDGLSSAAISALFGYGVLLQLADDLQDLSEDQSAGHSTPFVRAMCNGRLNETTCRLIHFTRSCVADLAAVSGSQGSAIEQLIGGSCTFLIVETIGRYRELFSNSILNTIEHALPVRSQFLAEMKQSLMRESIPHGRRAAASLSVSIA